MGARQAKLFDLPAAPRRVMAHVSDAGNAQCQADGNGPLLYDVQYTCARCGWLSGWIGNRTLKEHKSGWPCPVCN